MLLKPSPNAQLDSTTTGAGATSDSDPSGLLPDRDRTRDVSALPAVPRFFHGAGSRHDAGVVDWTGCAAQDMRFAR
jgi:hypothetical protein